jgi:hypothetical protein
MNFLADLCIFLWASVTNLVALLSGVVGLVIEMIRRRYKWEVPNTWYVWIVVVCLMLGMFSAWRDEHEQVVNLQKWINLAAAARVSQGDGVAQVRVTKEGALSVSSNLSAYGLSVKKIEFEGGPAYTLTFEKEPEYFRVDAEALATVEVVKVGPNMHRVKFVGVGRGRPAIEADFLVTMSPLNM